MIASTTCLRVTGFDIKFANIISDVPSVTVAITFIPAFLNAVSGVSIGTLGFAVL